MTIYFNRMNIEREQVFAIQYNSQFWISKKTYI